MQRRCGRPPRRRGALQWSSYLPERDLTALKLTRIGNSVGLLLPEELLARLKVGPGDTLFVTEVADGVVLSPSNPALEEQLGHGREFMNAYRDAFRQLAR